MPQAKNITVKDSAGVDVTFVLYTPGSDNAPAVWKIKQGDNPRLFPTITVVARPTGNGARKCVASLSSFHQPTPDARVSQRITEYRATTPDEFPESKRDDPDVLMRNFLAHPDIQASTRDGLSLT